jgi:hypothetical protein
MTGARIVTGPGRRPGRRPGCRPGRRPDLRRPPIVAVVCGLVLAAAGCSSPPEDRPAPAAREDTLAAEVGIVRIPLGGGLADPAAELSGLAWFGDDLVLLPQYPDRFADGEGAGSLFAIPRERLLACLDGADTTAVVPRRIAFVAPGLEDAIAGYNGLEAIAFAGTRAYLAIEARRSSGARGFLVSGRMDAQGAVLTLDGRAPVAIPSRVRLDNMSEEALLMVGDEVLVLSEVNGAVVNPQARSFLFDRDLALLAAVPMPPLEYRVTDATAIDEEGCFWVTNFFYPGERALLRPAADPLVRAHGSGATHARCETVERLVELRYSDGGIALMDTPPMQLELISDELCRNWEGLARLEGRGFLLVTDRHPETILAFVPRPPPGSR